MAHIFFFLSRIWGIEEQRTTYLLYEGLEHCPSHSWGEEGVAFFLAHHFTSYTPNLLPYLKPTGDFKKTTNRDGSFLLEHLLHLPSGIPHLPCFRGILLNFPYQSLFMSSTSQCFKISGLHTFLPTLIH